MTKCKYGYDVDCGGEDCICCELYAEYQAELSAPQESMESDWW